ncbi:hypothetical protein HGRIS_007047 [Hohenbuehelia grisea]|uniref:Uncharacterized protein n=1 Tax=Hohenbuehelia grisea TaxID=104357 RepID=A0ABR3JB86_9AGAR
MTLEMMDMRLTNGSTKLLVEEERVVVVKEEEALALAGAVMEGRALEALEDEVMFMMREHLDVREERMHMCTWSND